jgi:simple sugar transport system ATP-binding protein
VMALSDVIHVIADGRLSPEFKRGEMTPAQLGLWMAGQGFETDVLHAS